MKQCLACKEYKNTAEFTINKAKPDGLDIYCKTCNKQKLKDRQHSRTGLISRIFSNQKTNSKKRGHVLPNYTIQELREWCLSQKIYHTLYEEWVQSDFKKGKSPSCDRIDDSKPYTLDNIQLMSWDDNKAKGHKSISDNTIQNSGLLHGGHRQVDMLTLEGQYIKTFISMRRAAAESNAHQANISKCCRGKLNKTGGYRWRYTNA